MKMCPAYHDAARPMDDGLNCAYYTPHLTYLRNKETMAQKGSREMARVPQVSYKKDESVVNGDKKQETVRNRYPARNFRTCRPYVKQKIRNASAFQSSTSST